MVTKATQEDEQELISALKELRESYAEYQRRVRTEPLTSRDIEAIPFEDLEAVTRRYEAAEERYRGALKRVGRLVPYHPGFDEEGFGARRLRNLRGAKIEPAEVEEGTQHVTNMLGPGPDWMLKTWLLGPRNTSFDPSTLKSALEFDNMTKRPGGQPLYGRFLRPAAFSFESHSRWQISTGTMKIRTVPGRTIGEATTREQAEAFNAYETGALVWRGLLPEDRMQQVGVFWLEPAFLTIHQLLAVAAGYWHGLIDEAEVALSIAIHGLRGRHLLRIETGAEVGSPCHREMFEYRGEINSLDLYTNVLRLALRISEMFFESFDWQGHLELRDLQRRTITLAS